MTVTKALLANQTKWYEILQKSPADRISAAEIATEEILSQLGEPNSAQFAAGFDYATGLFNLLLKTEQLPQAYEAMKHVNACLASRVKL